MNKKKYPNRLSFEITTDPTRAFCMGRNGLADIKGLKVWTGDGKVFIDCITKRGQILNGGICLNPEALTELASQWLFETAGTNDPRGYKARK